VEDLEEEMQDIFNTGSKKPGKDDVPSETTVQSQGMQQFLKKYQKRKMQT